MGWFKRVNEVVNGESEIWLAYLHGQKYEELKHLSESHKKYKGAFTRFSIWLYLLIKQTSLRFKPNKKKCKFLIYSGTINQKNAIEQTVEALRNRNQSICCIAPNGMLSKSDLTSQTYMIKTYGILELFKSLFLLAFRFNALRKQLKEKSKNLIRNDFNVFLNVYSELVYFDKLLSMTEPQYVVVSNDHSEPNRALLALARYKKIKTVYMQHASVSKLFPALNVDYAFLDGNFSLNIYRNCEENFKVGTKKIENRKIFLSGQKKKLQVLTKNVDMKVGIALNALDSVEESMELVGYIMKSGFQLKLRWHPGLSKRIIVDLRKKLEEYGVEISDPKDESLIEFFSNIKFLIAGNSSIHLEAALSGVVPIYFEISKTGITDYYLYVENGLADKCNSLEDIKEVLEKISKKDRYINAESVQFYSSTYSTEWEGKEGDLVAETLIGLSKNQEVPIEPVFL